MAAPTKPGSKRRDLIALVVALALLGGLVWGGVAAWHSFWDDTPCETAVRAYDRALFSVSRHGESPGLAAEVKKQQSIIDANGCEVYSPS